MSTTLRGVPLPLEVLTASCAALNFAFFSHKACAGEQRSARRAGALALALISLGALAEATLFAASGAEVPLGVRLPTVLGTMLLTALVVRYLAVTR